MAHRVALVRPNSSPLENFPALNCGSRENPHEVEIYEEIELRISPMFNSIKFPFPRTIKRGKNPHLALRRMITKSLKTCEHYFICGMEKFILLVKGLNYWRNRWRYTLFILLYFFIALLF